MTKQKDFCPALSSLQPWTWAFGALIAFLLAVLPLSATCAQISASDLATLHQRVQKTGWVHVVVTLERISLGSVVEADRTLVLQQLDAKAQKLYAELGSSAFPTGRWRSDLGFIGFYTDRAGIDKLAATSAVESFSPAVSGRRALAYQNDGSLDAIDDALVESPIVDVDLVLNTEEPAYSIQGDGSTRFEGPSEVNEVLDRLLTEPFAQHIRGIDRRRNPTLTPVVQAKINRVAFYGLINSVHVRAVRLRGSVDARAANWPDEFLQFADRIGEVDITVLLRGGSTYTLSHTGPKASQHQVDANTKALREILAAAGVQPFPAISATEAHMGLVFVRLSKSQIYRLYAQRDPRVLSVDGNKSSNVTRPAAGPTN
ncbi:MAG: hypothetical protein ACK4OE_14775 [Acidovorax sp.]|uniref:hypothetical protein n=1 Tax=Acidovorax sp. TaxID=1872122 RepID=UPI00391D687C